jgi:hypothetical protein
MAKVHPDQFIQVGEAILTAFPRHDRQAVAVRITASLVEILLRLQARESYPVTGKARQYVKDDFPPTASPSRPAPMRRTSSSGQGSWGGKPRSTSRASSKRAATLPSEGPKPASPFSTTSARPQASRMS